MARRWRSFFSFAGICPWHFRSARTFLARILENAEPLESRPLYEIQ
jgi:hypothetical protein